jgi:uncharacterized protein (DUF1499 family)
MAWTRTGLILAFVGVALLIAGPLGTRAGLWTFPVGFSVLALSLLCAVAAVVLSLIGAVTSGQLSLPALGMAVGLAVMAFPGTVILSARSAPRIHEITTDPQDPPPFVAVLSLRASAMNPPEYGGAEVAAQQLRAYPDIQPLMLRLNASQAFQRALAVVHELGWEEAGSDAASGRIEAVDTTFWFGFKDDVVIRIREAGDGARVDVRSKSRVGGGDAGANARRLRRFLNALRQMA